MVSLETTKNMNLPQKKQEDRPLSEKEEIEKKKSEELIKEEAIFRKLLTLSKRYLPWLVMGGLSSLINGALAPVFSVAFGNIMALLNDVIAN